PRKSRDRDKSGGRDPSSKPESASPLSNIPDQDSAAGAQDASPTAGTPPPTGSTPPSTPPDLRDQRASQTRRKFSSVPPPSSLGNRSSRDGRTTHFAALPVPKHALPAFSPKKLPRHNG